MSLTAATPRSLSSFLAGALLVSLISMAGAFLCSGCSGPGGPAGSGASPSPDAREAAAADPAAASDPATEAAEGEIRDLFATYLRLHAAKDMAGWQDLFLPGATAVETVPDGSIDSYPVTELAAYIAEKAKTLGSQHETLEDVRIEVAGNAASYATRYTLFHDGRNVDTGRAFFLLARKEGQWKITALTWFSE